MSQFSTNEQISLEKRIKTKQTIQKTNQDKIEDVYEIKKCVKFIQDHNYSKVCLQFPDHLLPDSIEVVHQLEQQLNRKVYVLGDTAYGSCCLDFTAAKHISADCLIHFGNVCLSTPENTIPFLNIYEKYDVDFGDMIKEISHKIKKTKGLTIVVDTPYLHKLRELSVFDVNIVSIVNIHDLSGPVLYLGENDRKLMNIYLKYKLDDLYYYDPKTSHEIINYSQDTKILKRRYFLAEKIKDSQTIGIVLSTLAVANYLQILNRTIDLIKRHEKKYYIISVGKPNPAKLANFPEIDVFVVIGCCMNEIYENRDYFKPIVTVCDLEIALNSNYKDGTFSYDFNHVLNNQIQVDKTDGDVSLLSGKIRNIKQDNVPENADEAGSTLMLRDGGTLALNSNFGAGYLSGRSWTGLEQDLGKTDVSLATEGRRGIPLNYDNELK